jgi:3',5'-cyclic AMP phosphodiesterase CpdA
MLKFLHLSDLHITTADADTQFDADVKIREALMVDLGKDERNGFNAIVVTGDIAYHGRAEEFARAKAWLEDVRKATGSSPESLFVVPGNHDVNQTTVSKDSSLWELHQSLRRQMSDSDRLANLNKKLHDPFDFLTALSEYRVLAAEYECPTSPKALAWVQVLDDKQVLEDGTPVRFHGLNSALISDQDDRKGNLLLGATQFHHFDAHPGYVNVVLCHHPHAWLMDGNEANDFFRRQAHLVLSGHDHIARFYMEGGSLRVFAGAVHPNPREGHWEPCYHVLRLSIDAAAKRTLIVRVETRVWRDRDKCFGPHVQESGLPYYEARIELPTWTSAKVLIGENPLSKPGELVLPSAPVMSVAATSTSDSYAASRRKLIVHFFRLGTIARYEAAIRAGVWEESDDALAGQARWARVFERAEKANKFGALWDAVAAVDGTLIGQTNPFNNLP